MNDALLVCELHAHSTWSDGVLRIRELVDMHGRNGVDVLCITDHIARAGDATPSIARDQWHGYLNEIEREAERAQRMYGLLLIPGAELTDNNEDPDKSAHVLAIGLRQNVSVDGGIVNAIVAARDHGCAIIAAHPYGPSDRTPKRATRRLSLQLGLFAPLIHRWELFNRRETFGWIAEASLPGIATGDVHRPEDVASWKTLLACDRTAESVVEHLRSDRRAYLLPATQFDALTLRRAA